MKSVSRRKDIRRGDRLRRKQKGKGERPVKAARPWESSGSLRDIYKTSTNDPHDSEQVTTVPTPPPPEPAKVVRNGVKVAQARLTAPVARPAGRQAGLLRETLSSQGRTVRLTREQGSYFGAHPYYAVTYGRRGRLARYTPSRGRAEALFEAFCRDVTDPARLRPRVYAEARL